MPLAIRADNLTKRYRLGSGGAQNLTERFRSMLGRLRRKPAVNNEFWALKGVSFEVNAGEVFGIIGRNGAGKSTLLKVLSRIVEPTGGRAELRGRVGSLLEVGTGFHPELTGRENIYLNGSVLGMSHREIQRNFDAIVQFAGVEQFIDTPVKRYSSGMYVRLGFAVAVHLEPEILIVDEVLAVGDAEFQKKCVEKMRSVGRTGRTVLIVSHNLAIVENLCSRVLTLRRGEGVGFGPAAEQVAKYLAEARDQAGPSIDLRGHPQRPPGATPIMTGLTLLADGTEGAAARMDGSFGFELAYELPRKPRDLRIGFALESAHGVKVATISPTFECPHLLDDPPAAGRVRGEVPTHNLMAGTYYVNVYAQAEGQWDAVEPAGAIDVVTGDVFGTGRVPLPHEAVTYLRCRWSKSW